MASHPVYSMTIAGLTIPESIQYDDKTLFLNGAGLRKIISIKLYIGALYLKKPMSDANAIIEANEPMGIRLLWLRQIPLQKMPKVWLSSFKLATDGNTEPFQEQIDKVIEFTKKEPIMRYVSFDFIYLPDKGLHLYVDSKGKKKLTGVIPGYEFKKVFFKIWLGERPCQENLKKALLTNTISADQ